MQPLRARVLPRSAFAALLPILLPILVSGGCVKSKGGPPLPLRTTIGPAGGSLVVGSGEVSLNVPAGALAQDLTISVASGQVAPLPGWIDVGPPYVFAPADTAFALPSQIVLPFSPTRVSAAVDPSEIRVGVRRASGQVGSLVPTFVDTQSVMLDSSELGTFWVVAPDVIDAASSFPLNDGDNYHYDTGLVVTVDRTTAEPNLAPLDVAKVMFALGGVVTGVYFDDRQNRLATLGEFADPARQQVFAQPVLLLDDRDAVGTVRPDFGAYQGFAPLGATIATDHGLAAVTTEIVERATITTVVGRFDTVRVVITTQFNDSRPAQGETLLECWFAAGVGPVAFRIPGSNAVAQLVQGTVGGQPVRGRF